MSSFAHDHSEPQGRNPFRTHSVTAENKIFSRSFVDFPQDQLGAELLSDTPTGVKAQVRRSPEQHMAAASVFSHWADAPTLNQKLAGSEPAASGYDGVRSRAAHQPESKSERTNRKNIDLMDINIKHRDKFSYVKKQGKYRGQRPPDANRLTINGHRLHLTKDSTIFSDDGAEIGRAHCMGKDQVKHDIRINAGAIRTIVTKDGQSIRCVLVFGTLSTGAASGWVNILDFEHAPALGKAQSTIKNGISDRRQDDHDKFGPGIIVVPTAVPAPLRELHTSTHQKPKNNLAGDYFMRPSGAVNLLVNLPGTDWSRVGVACDVLAKGAEFHKDNSVSEQHVPLFEGGKKGKQTNHFLIFVYGYSIRPGQDKSFRSYGWINKIMVPGLP